MLMDKQHYIPIVFGLFPLVLGIALKIAKIWFSNLKYIGLVAIVALGMFLVFGVEGDPSTKYLAFAVLLSGFCVLICQEESQQSPENFYSILIILGLTLSALLVQGITGRLFLSGLLGFAAFSLVREKNVSFRTTLVLLHFAVAVLLAFSSVLGGDNLKMFSGLLLAVTFLPLVPFHLPFVGMIKGAKGTLPGFWIVVWLALGLAELSRIHSSLSAGVLFAISLLSLFSAFYSTLAALGQKQSNLFVASATVAYVSLVWGLLNIFPGFSKWGIAFGMAVAFVLCGIFLTFSFVRQRYGWQIIGKLPGLAYPMPRFGTLMVLLVSVALFLPMFPTFSGLTTLPTIDSMDVNFIKVFLLFIAVWLGGGWFLLQMLHQTAFGAARTDLPYTDLRVAEVVAVTVLLLGAGYSGLFY